MMYLLILFNHGPVVTFILLKLIQELENIPYIVGPTLISIYSMYIPECTELNCGCLSVGTWKISVQ